MNYIYISSGSFGAEVLKHLDPKPTLVITGVDKLGGRGMKEMIQTPVKKLCLELHISFVEVKNKLDLRDRIYDLGEDQSLLKSKILNPKSCLYLLADFGIIIPQELLQVNEFGIWNIHPSLLPKYRGTTPIQTALLNDEKVTGVTLMQMDEKIDHGPIITQEKLTIDINDTNINLQTKLAHLGAHLFNEQTFRLSDLKTFRPQDHRLATFTKKLTKDDGFVPLAELAPYLEPIFKKYNLLHLLKSVEISRSQSKLVAISRSQLKLGNRPIVTNYNQLQPIPTNCNQLQLHNKIRALTPWPTVWTRLVDESVVKITESTYDERAKLTTIIEIERNGKKYRFK